MANGMLAGSTVQYNAKWITEVPIIINALLESAMCIGFEVKLVSETQCAVG
jgi:hypothetical protein